MRTGNCQNDDLIDIIIDLQERGFDHDFILDHEYIRCLQYGGKISPDDFEILETHYCSEKMHLKGNYILYGIQLKYLDLKGILMSNNKSYQYGMSVHLWQKFNNETVKIQKEFRPMNRPVYTGLSVDK